MHLRLGEFEVKSRQGGNSIGFLDRLTGRLKAFRRPLDRLKAFRRSVKRSKNQLNCHPDPLNRSRFSTSQTPPWTCSLGIRFSDEEIIHVALAFISHMNK